MNELMSEGNKASKLAKKERGAEARRGREGEREREEDTLKGMRQDKKRGKGEKVALWLGGG